MKEGSKADWLRAQREAKFSQSKSSRGDRQADAKSVDPRETAPLGARQAAGNAKAKRPAPREAKLEIPKRAAKPVPPLKPFGHSDASGAPQERQLGTISPKRGRPRIEDRDKPKPPKPWELAGMSRRSYFRREAERRQKEAK